MAIKTRQTTRVTNDLPSSYGTTSLFGDNTKTVFNHGEWGGSFSLKIITSETLLGIK